MRAVFSPKAGTATPHLAVDAYHLGWRHIIHYNTRGTRFHAAGFGPATDGLRVDCYDNPGDYLGSGIDGLEAYVHGNAQDQLCQISKRGKAVFFGDVGQTFLYGAKGGDIFVLGNAAGRPMINAVGKPKVVINGTALDFLAESFMAGDPLAGGGFAIVNGLRMRTTAAFPRLRSPIRAATCSRWLPAARFMCGTRNAPLWMNSSTAACSAAFRTTTGN